MKRGEKSNENSSLIINNNASFCGTVYPRFYKKAPQSNNVTAVYTNSGKLFSGKPVKLNIKKGVIRSLSNNNDQFYLSLTLPYDQALQTDHYILIDQNKVYTTESIGSSGKESSHITFRIKDKIIAEKLSKKLKLKLLLRKHPGYKLQTTFSTKQKQYKAGDPVQVKLNIKNIGTKSVAFTKGGRNRAPRDNQ